MSLRHAWNVINPEEENTRKYIYENETLLKKLHLKWVIKMTNQSYSTLEKAMFNTSSPRRGIYYTISSWKGTGTW